jgi:hypothetical protein
VRQLLADKIVVYDGSELTKIIAITYCRQLLDQGYYSTCVPASLLEDGLATLCAEYGIIRDISAISSNGVDGFFQA